MSGSESQKHAAAAEAIKHLKDGMLIGIGTGSTVAHFIKELEALVKTGLKVTGVPTSEETERKARESGIEITLAPDRMIDITFDGADEADLEGNLIKGGGGALLREKIVAFNSRKLYILVDTSKIKPKNEFGGYPLPIEVVPYLEDRTRAMIEDTGVKCSFRDGKKFRTDNGNLILDCAYGTIADPRSLESQLSRIPGVVEVGLFCSYADKIFEGTGEGCRIHQIG